MRVAMVDPSLFTLPYDRALGAGLATLGHHVTLHARPPGNDDNETDAVSLAADFYRLANRPGVMRLPGPMRLAVKGLDHAWSMLRLLRRLRRERPDVIHFQWLPLPLVDGPILPAFRAIAPLVLTVHDTNPFNGDPSARLQGAGMAACLNRFGRLILHTAQGAQRLQTRGIPPARITVVPHGLLPVAGASAEPDPMRQPPTFVLFGKIKPYKGADVLIEAFARLSLPLRRQARVRIVGKPYMDLAPLHALIQARGLADRVTIEPGFIPDAGISAILAPGTVAVFPYREIEASGVLMQALALARPVIASRLGGMTETLTDGLHGRLVPPEDPAALAAALTEMITRPEFRAACSRNALDLANHTLSWDDIARRTAEIYREAAAA